MNEEALAQRVGLGMLGALTVALLAVALLSGRTLAGVEEYQVEFGRIGGLKAGAPVHLSGLEVGKVQRITFAPGGRLRVAIAVRRKYRPYLHTNSELYIGLGGVLGEPSFEIGPPHGEPGPELAPGALATGIDPPRIDQFLHRMYENLVALTDELRAQRQTLDEFLHSVDHMLQTLGRIEREPGEVAALARRLKEGMTQARGLFTVLLEGTDGGELARSAYVQVRSTWRRLERAHEHLAPRIDRAMDGVDRILSVLTPEARAQVGGAVANLRTAATSGEMLIKDASQMMAWVQSGRGNLGAFLQDVELFDEIKGIHRMLKDRPWLVIGKPNKPKHE